MDPLTFKEYTVTKMQDAKNGRTFNIIQETERHEIAHKEPEDSSERKPSFANDSLKSATVFPATLQEHANKAALQEKSL